MEDNEIVATVKRNIIVVPTNLNQDLIKQHHQNLAYSSSERVQLDLKMNFLERNEENIAASVKFSN